MTISTEPAPLSYSGDDSTTAFPITWKYFAKSHVVATLRSSAGVETLWVLNTDYTLTAAGVEAGGTLTATTAPASGTTLVITLDPPNTQDKSLPLGGAFPSTSVEDALDVAAQRDARLEALFNRTLRVPKTDTQSDTELELPIDSDRASKFLAFDGDGSPIAAVGTSADLTPVSSFVNTLLDDADADAFITTLVNDSGIESATNILTTLPEVADMATLRALAWANGRRAYLRCHTTAADGGHGVFRRVTGAAASTYTHNGGTILVASGGDGSAAWLREINGPYNTSWFGTVADGVTSDSTAIQAAINAAPEGGQVVAPKKSGSYFIGTGLTIAKALAFVGLGHGEDQDTYPDLKGDTGVNILTIGSATGARILVEGFSFTNGARGIRFSQAAHQSIIQRVRFKSQTTAGIGEDNGASTSYIGCTLRDFVFHTCEVGIHLQRQYNQFRIESGRITDSVQEGILLANSNASQLPNVSLSHVIIESSGKNAINNNAGAIVTCYNCHFEDNGGTAAGSPWADIKASASGSIKASVTLHRCFFSTADANQLSERVHIVGPNVYVALYECGHASGDKIEETAGNVTGVDLLIVDDPESPSVWTVDNAIVDVTQFTPAAARMRFGGDGIRFKDLQYYRILRVTSDIDFPSIVDGASATSNVTVTGAALGDLADVSVDANTGLEFRAKVTATDTVTVRAFNLTGGAIDLANATFRIYVWKETT